MKIADADTHGGYVSMRALSGSRPRVRPAGILLAIAAGAAVALHVVAFDRFPTPWVDEAHFLLPALRLARHATLAVPELNAPDGLFWVPDGYYAVLAGVFALLPDTLAVARATSLLFTLGTLTAFTVIARRLDVHPFAGAVVAAAWALAPHVVIAGNNARMEALVVFIASAAVALLACGRGAAAVATAALAPVVHPAGLVVVAVLVGAAVVGRVRLRPRGVASWLAVGLAAAVIALEASYLATHWGLVVDDLAFQFARKRNNNPVLFDLERAPFLLPAAGGLVLLWTARVRLGASVPVLAALLGLALGFGVVQGAGQEMWYGVYAEPTPLALLTLAALGALTQGYAPKARRGATGTTRAATGLVVLIPAIAAAVWWANQPVQGFGLTDLRRGEWSEYVQGALAALERLDAGLERPTVVAVDRLSPITPALVVHPWEHLEFVQETPVSPIEGRTDALGRPIAYWLTTPARLNTTRLVHRVPAPPGASSPAIVYSSPQGNYELRLYAAPGLDSGDGGGSPAHDGGSG